MRNKVKILTLNIDNISMNQITDELLENIINKDKKRLIYTPNSEIIVRAYDDPKFHDMLNRADYLVPDGSGLLLASKIIGKPLKERVAGYDLMRNLLKNISDKDISVYFLGGKPDIIDVAVKNVKKDYSGINISGYHHGYFDKNTQIEIINEINLKKPDILMVGMGVPLQEKFLNTYFKQLDIKIGLAVGGSFDVLSGKVKRAPLWMQKMYLEWFYRLIQEPKRINRMMALPRFLYLIIKEKIKLI